MLLVVFGAGASYDSVPEIPPPPAPLAAVRPVVDDDENNRPPLANQLFDNRPIFLRAMQRFPDCKPLIPRLRKSGVAVEQQLAEFEEQADKFPPRHQQLAAIKYYLHLALCECQVLWDRRHIGITNYATLLDEIKRWRWEFKEKVCFVTFNYDTMIENAMKEVLHFDLTEGLDSYIRTDYSLIKLHGSVNWGREIDDLMIPPGFGQQDIIYRAPDLHITNRYRLTASAPMLFEGENAAGYRVVLFPALAIPVDKKDDFECPDSHVKALEERLPHVDRILTIGWRAREAKFLEMLKSKLTPPQRLWVVSGDSNGGKETFDNLCSSAVRPILNSPGSVLNDGFTGLISSGMGSLQAFLWNAKRKATP